MGLQVIGYGIGVTSYGSQGDWIWDRGDHLWEMHVGDQLWDHLGASSGASLKRALLSHLRNR